MQTIKKIWDWVVWSSADPTKIALTVKAGIPLIAFLGLSRYASAADIGTFGDALASTVVAIGTIASGLVTLYGILRKVVFTTLN